ncbi:mitochondrial ATP synthase subunit 4 [Drechslerella stenobrocha 248]|uniref:ATP synthase subunit 4 n=1 Tax=Drechslerella stenobrocha 248 TaxID=1043628 RepID=W7I0H5_9PEZI|nr:mitochondrial ATP synthase subunit 4 [Drechslerella stenobrocha 248]
MASRLTRVATGLTRLRPSAALLNSHIPAVRPASQARFETNYPPPASQQQSPEAKAKSILDAVPGNSIASKTAILSATAGLSIAAISNEILVINEEFVVAFCLICMYTGVARIMSPLYNDWADAHIKRVKDVLYAARSDHKGAIQERIDQVSEMKDVVQITKDLFAISKETAQLEAEAFVLDQQTSFSNEAKQVLDSWVRYEAQVKQREQKELAEAIINKISAELKNPKTLQQILQQSITDVERIVAQK